MPGVERRRTLDVHALRAARQDDRRRGALLHLGGGDAVRHDLGVHPQLAHAPGDELGVLRTEVDDQRRCRDLTRGWLVDAIDSRT